MEWLAFSIACVATIYFAIHYRGFRRGLMFVAGGVIALAAAAVIYFWNDNRQTEARRQIASKLIRLDQIRVLDAKLALGSFAEMSGTIVNRSDFELLGLAIKVVVSDCPRSEWLRIKIDGLGIVEVGNSFLSMSPDAQNAFVADVVAHAAKGVRSSSELAMRRRGQAADATVAVPQRETAPPSSDSAKSDGEWWKLAPLAPTQPGEPTAPGQSQDRKAASNPKHEKPWEPYKKEQDDAQCGIVGEGVAHLYSIDVPKGQKRAFETQVTLPKLPEMKEWSWRYSIEEPIAKY